MDTLRPADARSHAPPAAEDSLKPRRRTKATGWRKLASSVWGTPDNPQILGELEVDATAVLRFIDDIRAETGVRVTVTHVVGKALAHAFAEHPDLNSYLSGGRFVERESIDIFFVVSVAGGRDLSGVKVREADRKSVSEIAEEVARRAERMRAGEDADFGKTKRMTDATPRPVLRAALKLGDWLTVDRNLDLKRVGLPRQAFGSAMVSSVASFGVQRAFTPLSPYYRVPLVVLISEVTQKAVVVDGEVVARPMLTLSATLDHRYLDGSDAGRLARAVRAFLENPGAQVS
ncbi:MAG: hypothetical protein QOE36_3366 [Gaiellaceae bacterium]|nr:hypothetical protein [Gaiellaceae bacterium]